MLPPSYSKGKSQTAYSSTKIPSLATCLSSHSLQDPVPLLQVSQQLCPHLPFQLTPPLHSLPLSPLSLRSSPPANPSLQTLYLWPTLFLCLWPTYMEHPPTFPPSKTLPLFLPVCPQDLPISTLQTLFPCLQQDPVTQPSYVLVCLSAPVCVCELF